jgi:hypothetical protein
MNGIESIPWQASVAALACWALGLTILLAPLFIRK